MASWEESARRTEAVHQVDSTFGVLLVIATLWANLYFTSLLQICRECGQTFLGLYNITVLISGLVLTVSIITGLVGMLLQNWRWRFFGWWFCLYYFLQTSFFMLDLVIVAPFSLPIVTERALHSVMLFVELIVPYLIVREVVVVAYTRRVMQVSSVDQRLDREARIWRRAMLVFLASAGMAVFLRFFG
jgi:hypothetical protein